MKPNKIMRRAIAQGRALVEQVKPCLACNGSGRYDTTNSPRCASCNGTGQEKKR